ncbi:MAG: hypothetical protein ACRERD_12505 [Candidatus Binatia bacterium]
MEPTFKLATHSDIDTLLRLMPEFYEHERLQFDERTRSALEQLLGDKALGQVWLICDGDEAIGYVVLALGFSLEYHGRDAFVDEFYVQASHRG